MVEPILRLGSVTNDGAVVSKITNTTVEFIDESGRLVELTHAEALAAVRKENE